MVFQRINDIDSKSFNQIRHPKSQKPLLEIAQEYSSYRRILQSFCTMKIFNTAQKHLATVGFTPPKLLEHKSQLNLTNAVVLLLFLIIAGFSNAILVFGANSLSDFGISLYASATATIIPAIFIAFINKTEFIFQTIQRFEVTIQKRKCSTETRKKTL